MYGSLDFTGRLAAVVVFPGQWLKGIQASHSNEVVFADPDAKKEGTRVTQVALPWGEIMSLVGHGLGSLVQEVDPKTGKAKSRLVFWPGDSRDVTGGVPITACRWRRETRLPVAVYQNPDHSLVLVVLGHLPTTDEPNATLGRLITLTIHRPSNWASGGGWPDRPLGVALSNAEARRSPK